MLAAGNAEVKAKHKLAFPVLGDPGNAYARSLGLAFELPADLRATYGGFGIDLEAHNGDDSWTLPMPARLVVNGDGVIRSIASDPDYTIRPEPEETLELVRGI